MKRAQRGWFSAPAIVITVIFSAVLVAHYHEILDKRLLLMKNAAADTRVLSNEAGGIERDVLFQRPSQLSECVSFCPLTTVNWKQESLFGRRYWFTSHYIVNENGDRLTRVCITQNKHTTRCFWQKNRTQLGSARIVIR
ncbi:hypothetical protein GV054_15480 [Marinomonas mediterranea]|uniref:hypothetical protein n=1 Tax=Marinomonas mediterranea TaxID=119864 RepID=UPI00234A2381|nr:hypothetical protein [Marinomonas mediterranea]WCN14292.1 hypothetical protein GV054_15480 [Marinomonas mediterranea]